MKGTNAKDDYQHFAGGGGEGGGDSSVVRAPDS